MSLEVRPLRPDEVGEAADAWLRARHAAFPAIPTAVHPDDEGRRYFADVLVPTSDVRVAVAEGKVVGVLVLRGGDLDHLYVVPEHAGQGTGSQLLRLAQDLQPEGLQLWIFQSNVDARRFYERHGFVEVEATDGSGNEERAPDARLVWPGRRDPQASTVTAVNIDPAADNRIHDDDVAQRFGFAGALVPGVEVLALAAGPLVDAWGEAFLAGGRLSLRFRRPVYDRESVTVSATANAAGYDVVLSGPDGSPRATGLAEPPSRQPEPAPYDDVPLPDALAAEPRVGPFGTVVQAADAQACADYVRAIGDAHPLYEQVVHPGLLLRLVNLALMRNVALGPWIHTASDCRFLHPARVGEDVAVRSRVTEVFSRKGHDYVRYDALVLAAGRPVAEVHHEAIWRLAAQDPPA